MSIGKHNLSTMCKLKLEKNLTLLKGFNFLWKKKAWPFITWQHIWQVGFDHENQERKEVINDRGPIRCLYTQTFDQLFIDPKVNTNLH